MKERYAIGDVARRTGLSVSTIRFYADEGIVEPTALTEGGFRQYDVHAIARLELVRTLRDLGAGLDDIRRVLTAETTLPDLARAHLRLVEDQLRQFRARRAMLRTVVRQQTTTDQVSLLHKLVSMSDDARTCPKSLPPSSSKRGSPSPRSCRTTSSARLCGSSTTVPSAPRGAS